MPPRRSRAVPPRGALVWFRRDLRDQDHAALARALGDGGPVYAAFVFDREILDALRSPDDRRVEFIHQCLEALDAELAALGREHGVRGVRLLVRHGDAADEIVALADALHVQAVFANHDDEPYALSRDAAAALLAGGVGSLCELPTAGACARGDLTLTDVAEVLNISQSQVYALVRNNELAAIKIGGRGQWRVERDKLEDYIARMYRQTSRFIAEHPFVEAAGGEPEDV